MVAIYKVSSPSGKVYIGQSRNIKRRFTHYKSPSGAKDQTKLKASFLKYGVTSHTFEIVHELPVDVEQEMLNRYEQLYIDCYRDAGFKMLNLNGVSGGGHRSNETKRRISIANLGHHRMSGCKQSKEWLSNRISSLRKSTGRRINQYDKDGNYIRTFPTIKDASVIYKIPITNISKVASGKTTRNFAGGYKWEYSDN